MKKTDEEILNLAPPNSFYYVPSLDQYVDEGGCRLNKKGRWSEFGPDTLEEPTRSLADIREISKHKSEYMFHSIEDYEETVAGTVGDAFRIAWSLARTKI